MSSQKHGSKGPNQDPRQKSSLKTARHLYNIADIWPYSSFSKSCRLKIILGRKYDADFFMSCLCVSQYYLLNFAHCATPPSPSMIIINSQEIAYIFTSIPMFHFFQKLQINCIFALMESIKQRLGTSINLSSKSFADFAADSFTSSWGVRKYV